MSEPRAGRFEEAYAGRQQAARRLSTSEVAVSVGGPGEPSMRTGLLLATLCAACATGGSTPGPTSAAPASTESAEVASAGVVELVGRLGGTFERDASRPGQPIVK